MVNMSVSVPYRHACSTYIWQKIIQHPVRARIAVEIHAKHPCHVMELVYKLVSDSKT